MKLATALIAALLLSGCAHKIRYQRIACISQEQLNELKAQRPQAIRDKLTGEADKDLLLVTGKLIRVEAWGDGLLDVLGNCAGT
jgi:hypothetical protein